MNKRRVLLVVAALLQVPCSIGAFQARHALKLTRKRPERSSRVDPTFFAPPRSTFSMLRATHAASSQQQPNNNDTQTAGNRDFRGKNGYDQLLTAQETEPIERSADALEAEAPVGNEADVTGSEGLLEDDSANEMSYLKFRATSYDLSQAAIVGVATGLCVVVFKRSIEAIKEACYEQPLMVTHPYLRALIPPLGGAAVGLTRLLGPFPPGLSGTVKEVDNVARGQVRDLTQRLRSQLAFLRKAASAVFTLGSGCSLGPEGPCVEIGMNAARACMDISPRERRFGTPHWNRLLLSCGAAAGVAAGFNAPIAGVFFALEIVQGTFNSLENGHEDDESIRRPGAQSMLSATYSITPILVSSVIAALVARRHLGDHLILTLNEYALQTPLHEMPLYIVLGILSGFVATTFSRAAKFCKSLFSGTVGPSLLRSVVQKAPECVKPIVGGLVCGVIALKFPEILFFGYGTIDPLMANNSLPTVHLVSLLAVKTIMTAFCAGSGLVGGTFAPSLFLGATAGGAFHNTIAGLASLTMVPAFQLADVPAYAMVGAASVLAALFRAPLTASLLLFEITRDYDVILPIMASAGVASVCGDVMDAKFKRAKLRRLRRDHDAVSWGDLATQQ